MECGFLCVYLWHRDSRTFHQGIEAQKTRAEQNFRMVVYVCMMPRAQASPLSLKKRIKAFEERRMTTHWASNPKLFAKMPRTYGKEVPEMNTVPTPSLTSIGRKLVGY